MLIHIEFMSGNPFQLIAHYSAADADINISAGLCHRGQEAGAGDWGHWPALTHKTLRHQQPGQQQPKQPGQASIQWSYFYLLVKSHDAKDIEAESSSFLVFYRV